MQLVVMQFLELSLVRYGDHRDVKLLEAAVEVELGGRGREGWNKGERESEVVKGHQS